MTTISNFAPYASSAHASRGRVHSEKSNDRNKYRNIFQRDRDRIIHSTSFRKLEYKTQVFAIDISDYHRTRLTHSIEVAQVARSIANSLNFNQDLTESIALAHDIGHSPFGHSGEKALQEIAINFNSSFNHNVQAFRIITELEEKYLEFNGLNLSIETIMGIVKHGGKIDKEPHKSIQIFDDNFDLKLDLQPSGEAQIASIADDITYIHHDIDDAFRSKILSFEQLVEMPIVGDYIKKYKTEFKNSSDSIVVSQALSNTINEIINDLITNSKNAIENYKIKSPQDIELNDNPVIVFSDEMLDLTMCLKNLLRKNVYYSYLVCRSSAKASKMIEELFYFYKTNISCLPNEWQKKINNAGCEQKKIEFIIDFISGMTDRFAQKEYLTCCV